MLNKQICKLCWRKYDWEWTAFVDKTWKQGRVCCNHSDWVYAEVNDAPPKECPYSLEHLLESQKHAK